MRQLSEPIRDNEEGRFGALCRRERSENVNGNRLEWDESREQLKTVQMFPESDAVLSARVAAGDGVQGVCCYLWLIEMASQTVVHLVLAEVTGDDDVVHQR